MVKSTGAIYPKATSPRADEPTLPLVWCAGGAAAGGGAAGGGAGACLFLARARLSEEAGRERGGGGWLEVRVAEDEAVESGRGVGRPSADSSERAGLTLRSPALPDDKLLSPVDCQGKGDR